MATSYGRDVWCDDSLRTGRYATGVRLVAQNAYHRLTTPRGMLRGGEDEANYGLDLVGLVGTAESTGLAAALPGKIQNELLKDERIEEVRATVTRSQDGPAVTYEIEIEADTSEGPFELVLSVADVTVALLKLLPEAV